MKQKRLTYGSFKNMTPDEQRAHMLMMRARYRAKNRNKIRAEQRYYKKLYMETKPYLCVCTKCGQEFNAHRSDCKRCEQCRSIPSKSALHREKVRARKEIWAHIIELSRMGMQYKEISKITGYSQHGISLICIRNGVRRRQYIPRKK